MVKVFAWGGDNLDILSEQIDWAIEKSAAVISRYQQASGAYPASPNFEVYQYSWIRDGAFIADAMSRIGKNASAERFFNWCSILITNRREAILSGQHLNARYTYDGQDPTGDWGSYQLDGYGTLLWAIQQHKQRYGLGEEMYAEATGLIQHYLNVHWQEPCFDWWEEKEGIHAATLACVYAGLKAFAHPTADLVKASIDLKSERVDSSLIVCGLFDAVDQEQIDPEIKAIETNLTGPDGGVYRYADDSYYGGGEWPIVTGLLGWYYLKNGRKNQAALKLNWLIEHMKDSGWLPEQVKTNMLHPEFYDQWVAKLGHPANPLLWSQAALITLASELSKA